MIRVILLLVCVLVSLSQCQDLCNPIRRPYFVNKTNLAQVQVIMRHGARTPYPPCFGSDVQWECTLTHEEKPSYNKDFNLYLKKFIPNRNQYRGNCGTGILTDVGYKQQVMNGKYIKDTYSGFLPYKVGPNMWDDDFYVRSTDVPRTFLSAESFLTGLYPPENRTQTFSIDIHTMDYNEDDMFPNSIICPRMEQYEKAFFASKQYQQYLKDVLNPLAAQLTKLIGQEITGDKVIDVYDCWISELCNGYGLPDGIDMSMMRTIEEHFSYVWAQKYSYPDRISGVAVHIGIFLNEFLENLEQPDEKKFILYSAHDLTLLAMLLAVDNWDGRWPTYADMLIVETYVKGNQKTVRFMYDGEPLILPGCQEFCPISQIRTIFAPLIPTPEQCEVDAGFVSSNFIYKYR